MMKRTRAIWATLVPVLLGSQALAGEITTIFVGDANGGVTLDSAGDIYAANYGAINATTASEPVWKISPTDAFTPFMFVTDINIASGNDFDSQDNLYQSNFGGDGVTKVDPSGVATSFGGTVNGPVGIAIDDMDNVIVNGCQENRIMQIAPDGTTTVFVDSAMLNCPNGITRAADGTFYAINWQDGNIFQITAAGAISNFASVPSPGGHLTIAGDRLYATSFGANQIFGIPLSGADAGNVVVTIGTGAAGAADGGYFEASFNQPNGITTDATGEVLYVTDGTGVRKIVLEDEVAPAPPPPPPAPPPAAGGGGGGGVTGFGLLGGLLMLCLARRRLRVAG